MGHEELLEILNQVGQKTVFFGPQGFELFTTREDVGQAQVGYGLNEHGEPISGEGKGEWQYSWLVIGKDTELGDAYFIDLDDDACPVYTAFKGEDSWEVEQVSSSVLSFMQCLQVLFSHGEQKSAAFVAEGDTIMAPELLEKLKSELVATSHCERFWVTFFKGYSDWLSDES